MTSVYSNIKSINKVRNTNNLYFNLIKVVIIVLISIYIHNVAIATVSSTETTDCSFSSYEYILDN